MSHKPPLPEAATPPYPAEPAPIEYHATPETGDRATAGEAAEDDTADHQASAIVTARNIGIAAGAAIGSAAVAAALLYYNRPATSAKRGSGKAPPKRTAKPKAATARKPRSTTAKTTAKSAAVKASTATKTAKPAAKPRARAKPKPAASND